MKYRQTLILKFKASMSFFIILMIRTKNAWSFNWRDVYFLCSFCHNVGDCYLVTSHAFWLFNSIWGYAWLSIHRVMLSSVSVPFNSQESLSAERDVHKLSTGCLTRLCRCLQDRVALFTSPNSLIIYQLVYSARVAMWYLRCFPASCYLIIFCLFRTSFILNPTINERTFKLGNKNLFFLLQYEIIRFGLWSVL